MSSQEERDELEGNAEEEAANLSNELADAARTLMSEYGWSKDDVIDNLSAMLEE